MESIVAIVGFLGSGKTTLLKQITKHFVSKNISPNIILNDYENASIDAQDFLSFLEPSQISALSGSCICCSGINELREQVNRIPARQNGITLIEANGTTDAVSLMGFLGVGMEKHFLPPIQIAIVDARNWQKRGDYNDLELNQVQVSSVIILNFTENIDLSERHRVESDLKLVNPNALIVDWNNFDIDSIIGLGQIVNEDVKKLEHHKAHWASCSIDLPIEMSSDDLKEIVDSISLDILRVKGFYKDEKHGNYTHFERVPSGEMNVRPYNGVPVLGPKLLTIGPGSNPVALQKIVDNVLNMPQQQ